jgi:hypothetical protein
MTNRQILLWWRYLATGVTMHAASLAVPARYRTQVGNDLAGDAMREVYGGVPGATWGRPDRTTQEELEEYALADLTYIQLMAMESAALRMKLVPAEGG